MGPDSMDLSLGGRGWLRRYAPSMWGAGSNIGSLEAVRKRAFVTLVGSITRIGSYEWLTSLDSMLKAEDRLYQLQVAERMDCHVPTSVVASDVGDARCVLGESFVVKPLSNGFYHSEDGPKAVFTSELTGEDFDRVDFAHAPFVAQERIDVESHFRIVTVLDQGWAARLDAAGRPLDWRRQEEAHSRWEEIDVPELISNAVRLSQQFGVGYSSQDWVRDHHGRDVFLDLNPGGQWMFLPPPVAESVCRSIAEFLSGAGRQ